MKTELQNQMLMRIFLSESQRHRAKPVYHEILEQLRRENIAGLTILRGIAGFGASHHAHEAKILELSHDLPIIIEAVDTAENIEQAMATIEPMLTDALVTVEKVRAFRFKKG